MESDGHLIHFYENDRNLDFFCLVLLLQNPFITYFQIKNISEHLELKKKQAHKHWGCLSNFTIKKLEYPCYENKKTYLLVLVLLYPLFLPFFFRGIQGF